MKEQKKLLETTKFLQKNPLSAENGYFSVFDILYQNVIFQIKIWQNEVMTLSPFCLKAVFGNMSTL
jgi:hypothetical protein